MDLATGDSLPLCFTSLPPGFLLGNQLGSLLFRTTFTQFAGSLDPGAKAAKEYNKRHAEDPGCVPIPDDTAWGGHTRGTKFKETKTNTKRGSKEVATAADREEIKMLLALV